MGGHSQFAMGIQTKKKPMQKLKSKNLCKKIDRLFNINRKVHEFSITTSSKNSREITLKNV
jgi:hypothetical protein